MLASLYEYWRRDARNPNPRDRLVTAAWEGRFADFVGEAIGGQRDTFSGLAGMGDLIVTCTSQRSRNRSVGEELGSGKPIAEILAGMKQVAEGVKAASVIMEFAEKYGINMPIAREVDAVVNHGSTVEQAYQGLMAEKPGHEVDGTRF